MDITTETGSQEVKLAVTGCLDTAATPTFVAAVDKAMGTAKTLVFDFADLEFIASSALRKLVSAQKALATEGGGIVIAGMSETVREVLDVTGLNEVFVLR